MLFCGRATVVGSKLRAAGNIFTENEPVEQTFDLIFRVNTFWSIIFINIKIENDHFALEQTQSWICNFIRIENGCLATFS